MRSFYARVEHKVVVGVDFVNLLAVTSLILTSQQLGASLGWARRLGEIFEVGSGGDRCRN